MAVAVAIYDYWQCAYGISGLVSMPPLLLAVCDTLGTDNDIACREALSARREAHLRISYSKKTDNYDFESLLNGKWQKKQIIMILNLF